MSPKSRKAIKLSLMPQIGNAITHRGVWQQNKKVQHIKKCISGIPIHS